MSNEATPPLSRLVRELAPSGIRKFFDVAASMQDVISLGVGEPDFVTPWAIREAAINSLKSGHTNYTSTYGDLRLRTAIAKHLDAMYGVRYDPKEEVLVTIGVSEGMDVAMRVLLDPGDEVIVPEPCYVSYKPCVALAGGVPVGVETLASDQFRISVEQIDAAWTPRTKAILLGYPSNPTGATMPREALQEIVDYAVRKNLYLISDEIYDRLTYDGQHTCVAALPGAWERTITLNGFSKAYAMTGWRIGYACAPEPILSAMNKVHNYSILCAPITGQMAALEALKVGESSVVDMVGQYNQRRRLIVEGLNRLGLDCHMPQGAFYAFPSIARTGLTAEEFAERLLFDEKVAVVPGTAFGRGGEKHIRCSYATSLEKIEIALQRMERFIKKLPASAQAA
ncbi:aminotransferase [Capsulimonas corticalis]|uniref:Aminotransferase n=1 Tax=Capsulimonas corticalis TaxID=2219043 RepID=A0A402CRU0_9BACT|nr:aminotransferase class I/II-fold pyridoxal phosphate-dependent enzyme [Capsulimonas corticalis]BDI28108.1 aminotransferase [Capsulimonas corticalis]